MPEKMKGKVKWFSNRKGFGFVSPEGGGDDIFLHHSRIVSDAEYKTLRDGFDVQFEVGTDDKGKPFADKVTSADGSPIPPPDPSRKKKAKKAKEGAGETDVAANGDAAAGEKTQEAKKKGNNRKKAKNGKKEAPKTWYSELDAEVQKAMEGRGIKLEAGRVFISVGDARLKVGTGGYITLAHKSGVVAEGKYTSDKDGKLVITWEKALKLDGDEWKASTVEAENGALMKELSLKDDSVKPTGSEENCDTLWGEGKPDPKDVLEKEGFLMRKVALTAAANPGRRGRGPRNRKRGPKKDGKKEGAAPAAAT
mmetsp:Transcript_67230/g.194406  ORF Transcript_67230/g.194406 Transcript_67230/m.194406 type:complete len:309 (+) Transcript_67230:105-1031(+)|eukprot:CAMPEP_0176086666 /NCGR_PEP_ID=MMETSP0120_2-20121206/43384_1 /TAXON_ID=160619 /ORGANISM="Kryptoperidinium foliaceum, Strain CCMP 1326" /LENGTH=308 /DNA_ID=CAMNT_0017420501 /DNA_START=104 /DNA_END=1030 /DNA_ORIENTATION=-